MGSIIVSRQPRGIVRRRKNIEWTHPLPELLYSVPSHDNARAEESAHDRRCWWFVEQCARPASRRPLGHLDAASLLAEIDGVDHVRPIRKS